MAIIVFDDFDRANTTDGLGTATTGQTWVDVFHYHGDWTINNNNALWRWVFTHTAGRQIIESGTTDGITKVTLVNPTSLPQNYGTGVGLVFRYIDTNYLWRLVYFKFPGPSNHLRLQRTYAGSTATVIDVTITLADNDVISVAYCGTDLEIFVNGVSKGTYDDSTNPHSYGTFSGLQGATGSYFNTFTQRFNDFTVETDGTCTPTYNCTGGACVDPGDGTGTFATLAACLTECAVATTYNCTDGQCVDPGDGTGTYSTLAECVSSGCGGGSVVVETVRFDAGTGSGYYYVAPIVDSEDELRSKTVKAARVTGKLTNAALEVYGYDVSDPIVTTDLEQGLNSTTGQIAITDTTGVTQTPREPVNVPNAVLHTVRVLGDDTGETTRDRIDEIVTEQSSIGVRR